MKPPLDVKVTSVYAVNMDAFLVWIPTSGLLECAVLTDALFAIWVRVHIPGSEHLLSPGMNHALASLCIRVDKEYRLVIGRRRATRTPAHATGGGAIAAPRCLPVRWGIRANLRLRRLGASWFSPFGERRLLVLFPLDAARTRPFALLATAFRRLPAPLAGAAEAAFDTGFCRGASLRGLFVFRGIRAPKVFTPKTFDVDPLAQIPPSRGKTT